MSPGAIGSHEPMAAFLERERCCYGS